MSIPIQPVSKKAKYVMQLAEQKASKIPEIAKGILGYLHIGNYHCTPIFNRVVTVQNSETSTPAVYLARMPLKGELPKLEKEGFTHIISITKEADHKKWIPHILARGRHMPFNNNLRQIRYNEEKDIYYDNKKDARMVNINFPVEDHEIPSLKILEKAADAMHKILSRDPKAKIYLHCLGGKGRSAQILAAYILKYLLVPYVYSNERDANIDPHALVKTAIRMINDRRLTSIQMEESKWVCDKDDKVVIKSNTLLATIAKIRNFVLNLFSTHRQITQPRVENLEAFVEHLLSGSFLIKLRFQKFYDQYKISEQSKETTLEAVINPKINGKISIAVIENVLKAKGFDDIAQSVSEIAKKRGNPNNHGIYGPYKKLEIYRRLMRINFPEYIPPRRAKNSQHYDKTLMGKKVNLNFLCDAIAKISRNPGIKYSLDKNQQQIIHQATLIGELMAGLNKQMTNDDFLKGLNKLLQQSNIPFKLNIGDRVNELNDQFNNLNSRFENFVNEKNVEDDSSINLLKEDDKEQFLQELERIFSTDIIEEVGKFAQKLLEITEIIYNNELNKNDKALLIKCAKIFIYKQLINNHVV